MTEPRGATSPARPLPEVSVYSGDPDEACEAGTRVYHRHRVSVLGEASHFAMSLEAATLGPLRVGWITYDTQVRIDSAHDGHYEINIPTAGTMLATSAGRQIVSDPATASVYLPDREANFTGWATPAPMFALRIARRALERELEQLLDRPISGPVELDLAMDISTGRGAQWWALSRSLAADLADANALIRQPVVAAPFAHSLMAGLLMAASHRYRDELLTPAPATSSSVVRTACAFIETNAQQPLTVAGIASAAGVGIRGLQQGFQRSLNLSPTQYLRQVRLRRVYHDLLAADPSLSTVGEIAAQWGFAHQGRFAAAYRERYGVQPADTLRRTR